MTGTGLYTLPKALRYSYLELILLILLVLYCGTDIWPAPANSEHATPVSRCRMDTPIGPRLPTFHICAQYLLKLPTLTHDLQERCKLLFLKLARDLTLLLE